MPIAEKTESCHISISAQQDTVCHLRGQAATRIAGAHNHHSAIKSTHTNNLKLRNMKKRLTTIIMLFIVSLAAFNITAQAQKYALLDMEYILKNIPAYERANEQLSQVSKKWQAEVEALNTEAATLYRNYQNEIVFLSQEQKKARQEAIIQKEKEAADLKKKYFGPEGELFKKREALMTPIQDEIYNTVKEIAELRNYSLVIDRSSDNGIIYGSPKVDISNEVLQKLGYQ